MDISGHRDSLAAGMGRKTRVLALTGGIASGKSSAMEEFGKLCPGMIAFSADAVVRRLLDGDAEVVAGVRRIFGDAAVDESGRVMRDSLRRRVFGDVGARRALERLLHPRVREDCLALLDQARRVAAPLFLAEIPLLFEGGFHFGQDANLLVAVSRRTQVARLRERDGIDPALAGRILDAQLPMEEKLSRADVVFWNEGPPACLQSQIRRFLH